jgi:hypothetical protein
MCLETLSKPFRNQEQEQEQEQKQDIYVGQAQRCYPQSDFYFCILDIIFHSR